jgi:putative transposase
MLLDDAAKEQFRRMMWRVVEFCGVELITYTIMSNHFHLLIRVVPRQPISDEELQQRVDNFYGSHSPYSVAVAEDIKLTGRISDCLRNRLLARMGDLSMCLKELKQRYTRWYNRMHERYGTLWSERFKSLLVEEKPYAVQLLAAYIDLNCVRAGIVDDPKDYRFCGYAEALVEEGRARRGLASFLEGETWIEQASRYRSLLFCRAAVSGHSNKKTLDRKTALETLAKGGTLSVTEILQLKVRYFTDGAALGTQAFLDNLFVSFRNHFGLKRSTAARCMAGADWTGLMVLRQLRLKVFG